MEYIKRYNDARKEIETPFIGLPHAHGKLIQLLITRADPTTGIVENLCCRDLATLLAVEHAPGRKGAGTPKIETIRSYLRTISKSCSDNFKLINQGQKLNIQFTNMPTIYAFFLTSKEVYGEDSPEQKPAQTIEKTNEISADDIFLGTYESTESPIQEPVKNINILNNNNNKFLLALPVSDNFTPTPDTIAKAYALGYQEATDFSVIQAFINYNKARGTQWVDYNPIYLIFLAKRAERKQQNKNTISWRTGNATESDYSKTRPASARERVKQAHASQFHLCEHTGQYIARNNQSSRTNCHTVVTTY